MIFYSALGILFTYLFAKELGDNKIGALSALLLALHPAYMYNSIKEGLFTSVPVMTFISMGCLFFFFRWNRRGKITDFLLAFLLMGMGLSTRIWFIWLIIALIAVKFILKINMSRLTTKSNSRLYLVKFFFLDSIGKYKNRVAL